jgi:hypothetical protein
MTRTLLLAGLVIVGLAYAPAITAIIALALLVRYYPRKEPA